MVLDNTRKLSKSEGLTLLKKVRTEFTSFYNQIANAFCTDDIVKELMAFRGYSSDEMFNTLKEVGVTRVFDMSELELIQPLHAYETSKYWGLFDKSGRYLLSGRYVVPIRDISGNVTALVGYYPDDRKYVTTPTFGFARDAQFFNIEQYAKFANEPNAKVYLVEGIFDTLSLRSLGLFALGNMGLGLSPIKREILKRFGHVYAIPDNDKAGRGVLPFTSAGRFKWNIDNNVTFVQIGIEGVKDTDDLVKMFDCKEDLLNLTDSYIAKVKETV